MECHLHCKYHRLIELLYLFSCPGKITQVSKSGYKYISDSSIRTKPSIEDPSNIILLSRAFVNWLTGISTFLITPKGP